MLYSVFMLLDPNGSPVLIGVTSQGVRGRMTALRGGARHKLKHRLHMAALDYFLIDNPHPTMTLELQTKDYNEAFALKFALIKEHASTLLMGRLVFGRVPDPDSPLQVTAARHRGKRATTGTHELVPLVQNPNPKRDKTGRFCK